jgi:hypothetical protein
MYNALNSKENLTAIPDPLAPAKEKLTISYGLTYAMAIQKEWFNGGKINSKTSFMERHEYVREMRTYNRGEQSIDKYKDMAAREKESLEWMNMDWTPINVVEKYTNIVRNGISDEFYRMDIRSADRFALLEQGNKILNHKINMASKDMLEKAKVLLGVDLTPKGFVPEDEEEMNLYNEIKERPKQEIAEEIIINYVKNVSNWGDYIKKETDKDLVLLDIQVARVFTDPNNGVQVEYVDPENYGHSFVERNDFRDAFYHFVVDTITINDLRRESGYSEEICRKIAALYGDDNKSNVANYGECDINKILNFRVNVMRFTFKSDTEQVWKAYRDKKGSLKKVSKRDSKYDVPEGAEKSKLSKRMDTWYEGSYVVGSNEYLYNYKESENIAVDDMDRVLPPFIAQSTNIYKNKLRSFLKNIIPLADQMQYIHLKLQHLIAELKPDLIEIDLDNVAELIADAKGDPVSNMKKIIGILDAKGIILKKRTNMGEDGIKEGPGARPIPNQQGSALAALLNSWQHYYNLIRETTGINPARDGTLSENALVGINQMMKLASNTSTKHIADAAVAFDKRVSGVISSRVKGIFSQRKEANHIVKMYETAVGKHNLEALSSLKDRHIHEFGFTIEMVPAKEELDELKQDLMIALQEGTIDVSEKSEIMRIARNNIKQATEYMSFIRRRRIKEKMKENEYNQKLQSESNAAAANAAAQAEMQTYEMKAQIDMAIEGNKSMMRLKELQAQLQINSPTEDKKFQQDVYIEQIKNMQTLNLKKYDNDKKSEREVANSSRQSKMIEQRQKDLNAFDFKNEFNIEDILN